MPKLLQNKKYAYLCIISRKMWGDEIDYLLADKQEDFLQVDSIALGVCSQDSPKYQK